MQSININPILGSPWLEGGRGGVDRGLDCSGVVLWCLEALGVAADELPIFPGASGQKVDPALVRASAALWYEVSLADRLRLGDVLFCRRSEEPGWEVPHLEVVVDQSPARCASAVEHDGVVTRLASRVKNVRHVYRWPAAAKLVGAPLPEFKSR